MPEALFEKEMRYQTIMGICRQLFTKGILSPEEYKSAEKLFQEKYQPVFTA